MQTGQFASAPDAVSRIVAKEGFKGLYAVKNASFFLFYRQFLAFMNLWSTCTFVVWFLILQGYGSFLLRDLPFDAIQFCIYEQLRMGYKLAVSLLRCFMLVVIYKASISFITIISRNTFIT